MKITIDKALKVIELWREEVEEVDEEDFSEAVQLGVEALIRIRRNRQNPQMPVYGLLPGETK